MIATLVFTFLQVVCQSETAVPTVWVGASKVDVTPDYPIRLSGYGNRRSVSEGVAQRIWAKALAIGRANDSAVLVTVDNCGVPLSVTEEVARRLVQKTDLARSRFVLCSSHTHTAPMLTGVLPNLFSMPIGPEEQKTVDRYTRRLTDAIESAAVEALADRRPCRLAWARGAAGFANNRRRPPGPVDNSLPMLCATDVDGKLRAVLVSYACHCTTLGGEFNRIHGDWAGCAQEAIERRHPGAIAMVAIGCGADCNPKLRRELEFAVRHGEEIAREVDRLLAGRLTPLGAVSSARYEQIEIPFEAAPDRAEWERRAALPKATGYHAKVQLARLERGEPLQKKLDYPVQTWAFGDDLAMVFLGGEVVVDYALRLAKEFDGNRLWVNAYCNDVPCYIASERVLREGGYEAESSMLYYDRPGRLAPGVEARIVNAVQRILPLEYYADNKRKGFPPPRSPQDSMAAIRTRPELRVELVAAEPLVVDPVAVDFGPDGKLWVAEMFDYPQGDDGKWSPGGRVRVLEDSNNDGEYDRATVFLRNIPFPTGLMAWRDGVLVCAAPDILFARDADQDGEADDVKVLFSGFATDNYQARVNGLSYGLDNWVYGANGLLGGTIRSHTGDSVTINGRDFRMRPDSGEFEPAAGLTQQGRIRDDFGNWFGTSNSTLLRHFPFPDRYVRRNPHLAPPAPMVYVPDFPESNRLYPISEPLERFNNPTSLNRVTSGCGAGLYRDTLWGRSFYGNVFVCEPAHNVVTRLVLSPHGATFKGKRAEDESSSEFLASTDNWFRPVQVRTAPDGSLWVVDMYRFVIEHPRWITTTRLASLNVRAGAGMGRIYRLRPTDRPLRPTANYRLLPTGALVAALDSPNGSRRDIVHQEIVHRGDRSAIDPLIRLAKRSPRPAVRVQALSALDGLHALESELLIHALSDPDPKVRRRALRLSEPLLSATPRLAEAVLERRDDPEFIVRYQLALSLGQWSNIRAGKALATLALSAKGDRYLLGAALNSAATNLEAMLDSLLADPKREPPAALLEPLLTLASATDNEPAITRIMSRATPASGESTHAQRRLQIVFLDSLQRRGSSLAAFHENAEPETRAACVSLSQACERARAVASSATAGERQRILAIRLLGRGLAKVEPDLAILAGLLLPQNSQAVQSAAVAALARIPSDRVPDLLLKGWRGYGPRLREEALDALLRRTRWQKALLDAIEDRTLRPADLDATRRERLTRHENAELQQRAVALFADSVNPDRKKVFLNYKDALPASGDVARGKKLFLKSCSVCHRYEGEGFEVGPDLATLTDRSPESLLAAVLDPNRAVEAKYLAYTAATLDGQLYSGRLVSETGSTVTLLGQQGKRFELLRSDLEALASTGKSLMPENLEKDLKPADFADVFAYLASGVPARRVFAGNEPKPIDPATTGALELFPAHGAIYGSSLRLVAGPQPIVENWTSDDDRVTWTLNVPRSQRYDVWLDWLCDDSVPNSRVVLSLDDDEDRRMEAAILATRDGRFRQTRIGAFDISAGTRTLTLRLRGPRPKVFKLRDVTLLPK